MTQSPKTIIIGLDGVPFGMVQALAGRGVMPNVQGLIRSGTFLPMDSTIPEVSSVAWSSMITGVNPGCHGIYGFTDLFPNSYQVRYPCYRDLKATPFWENGCGPCVILNVPGTYPVREMNGIHVSGFVSLDFSKSVYPKDLRPVLESMDYRLDVDSQKAAQSLELFYNDLEKTHRARIEAYRHTWSLVDWQVFMLVFTGTDRLMHFLWSAYEDSRHPFHQRFLDYFHSIDEVVEEIVSRLNPADRLVMLSDHGFERLEKNVYVNYLLKETGLLRFTSNPPASLKDIDSSSKAFAMDPARIYLHRQGRYPNGMVSQEQAGQVIEELESFFASVEIDGRKVVRRICRREEIFQGPCTDSAPDLVLVAAEGFNFKANLKAVKAADQDGFTGKHTQDTAFCLLHNMDGPPADRIAIDEVIGIAGLADNANVNQYGVANE
jgi:predicted AlkP superfamily phosphohydrolase/phosphomutase